MKVILAVAAACILTILVASCSQNTYIPYDLGGDNYYTMQGGPDISATVSGTDEFERGDTATLYVSLANYGGISGFQEDQVPQNPKEFKLADAELKEEYKKPTALGITLRLVSDSQQIEVASGDQVIESLKAGEKTRTPLSFKIKIGEHALAGEYPLTLNISYDYQDNVRISASELETRIGLSILEDYKISYIYQKESRTVPMVISVKKQADFETINATAAAEQVSAGDKNAIISATYRNIGEYPTRDAVARLYVFKPFSTTDDQAFIGDLQPGEETTVKFRLDVDSDATAKEYGIKSDIKYTDVNGQTVISESMKIPVTVKEAPSSLLLPALILLVLFTSAGGYWYRKKGCLRPCEVTGKNE